jgi:hypothetical protein
MRFHFGLARARAYFSGSSFADSLVRAIGASGFAVAHMALMSADVNAAAKAPPPPPSLTECEKKATAWCKTDKDCRVADRAKLLAFVARACPDDRARD